MRHFYSIFYRNIHLSSTYLTFFCFIEWNSTENHRENKKNSQVNSRYWIGWGICRVGITNQFVCSALSSIPYIGSSSIGHLSLYLAPFVNWDIACLNTVSPLFVYISKRSTRNASHSNQQQQTLPTIAASNTKQWLSFNAACSGQNETCEVFSGAPFSWDYRQAYSLHELEIYSLLQWLYSKTIFAFVCGLQNWIGDLIASQKKCRCHGSR